MHIWFSLLKHYLSALRIASLRQCALLPGLGARHKGIAVRTAGWTRVGSRIFRRCENKSKQTPIYHYKLNF